MCVDTLVPQAAPVIRVLYDSPDSLSHSLNNYLRATPLDTSQLSMLSARESASVDPSRTRPNPPLMTSPQPTPPPLCRETHVAPRKASPMQFWTAISEITNYQTIILQISTIRGLEQLSLK